MSEVQMVKMEPKISININTHRHMNPFFVNSMFFMICYMKDTGLKFEINSHMGVSNLCGGRQARVNDVLKSDCTHMLMLDDDMSFSRDLVHKMLGECNKLATSGIHDYALGVNPCRKSMSGLFYTAVPVDVKIPKGMEDFLQSKGKTGVAEVSRCGLGAFLIETRILREIAPPHFEIRWNEDNKEHMGEDFYFIEKLRSHGVRIFVDQDISQTMGHCGECVYSYGIYQDVPPS